VECSKHPGWHEGSVANCLADSPSLKAAGALGKGLIAIN
jgi:hypothetical protein